MATVTITLEDTEVEGGVFASIDSDRPIGCGKEPCTCTPAQRMAQALMQHMDSLVEPTHPWEPSDKPKRYRPDPALN